ncbi:hypothetical protein ACLM5J_07460 [Nocardioides sp. Bht2]|uniref:hypothetical protein n=1 Tax=Nocardioides sp. Bht2 TaxID=3392297 RepID=UPI0039B3B41E
MPLALHRSPVGNADGAPAFPRTVDEIAAALRENPVLVQEIVGNGQTAELRSALEQKAAALDVPVYVVMAKAPVGISTSEPNEELVVLLHQKLGDGVYYVLTHNDGYASPRVYGDVLPQDGNDETTLLHAFQRVDQVVNTKALNVCADCSSHPGAKAGLVLDVVAGATTEPRWDPEEPLTASQISAYTADPWVHRAVQMKWDDTPSDFEPSVGLSALVATLTALVTTVVAYRLIQAVRSPRTPVDDTTLTQQLQRSKQVLDNAERALDRARSRGLDPAVESQALEQMERARALQQSKDRLDQVGAIVLTRMAERTIASKGREQYQACYLNPLHGEAALELTLGGGLTVPVCKRCERRHQASHPADALREQRSLGRQRPYYDGTSVWANNGYGALDPEFWRKVGR